jgi:hypothetical protein
MCLVFGWKVEAKLPCVCHRGEVINNVLNPFFREFSMCLIGVLSKLPLDYHYKFRLVSQCLYLNAGWVQNIQLHLTKVTK